MSVTIRHPEKLIYPISDGKPMGDNTLQMKWIFSLYGGFEALFQHDSQVFVAANLFWYPIHGDPTTVTAPDVMIAFGRPKSERLSYKQWEEGNVAPQVVIEVQSKSSTKSDLAETLAFYDEFQVEEYYLYNPYRFRLEAWTRTGRNLIPVPQANDFLSPRLKVRFVAPGTKPMQLIRPDGEPFRTYLELVEQNQATQEQAAEDRRKAAEERRVKERLAAKLRELGIDPDSL